MNYNSMTKTLVLAGLLLCSTAAQAEIPQAIHYQGYLTDTAGTPVSGEWTVTFTLFNDEQAGTVQHEETLLVDVQMGVFDALLGAEDIELSKEALQSGALWLQVTVLADDGPVTLLPRQRVVSAPYALLAAQAQFAEEAGNAQTVGGISADTLATVEQIAGMCIAPDSLEQALLDLGFSPAAGYSDADVQTYLEENGYLPATPGYTDADVQTYLEQNGYLPAAPGYTDEDVQAFLDQEGYHSGPHYSDADTQAWLGDNGFVSGPHYSDGDTQAWLEQQGYVVGEHLTIEQCLEAVEDVGYLKPGEPIPPEMLPPDGLDEVSNNLLTTTFDATFNSAAPVPIIDGFLAGVQDMIVIPDVGLVQDLTVSLDIEHATANDLKVTLQTPAGDLLVLHDHGQAIGNGIQTNFDLETAPVVGDLSLLDGKSPAGTWILHIVDDVLSADGTLNGWSIQVESLSAQNVLVSGSVQIEGAFSLAGSNVNSSTLEQLTGGADSVADALHTHTNLAVYFKEGTNVWSGGGGTTVTPSNYQNIYSGAISSSDPSTATLTFKSISVGGNHAPGWAGYVCLCAKGSITGSDSGTIQLEEKCGGATNQQVTVSWSLAPALISSKPGSISMQGKSCGGGIKFGAVSVTGDQYLPVRNVK